MQCKYFEISCISGLEIPIEYVMLGLELRTDLTNLEREESSKRQQHEAGLQSLQQTWQDNDTMLTLPWNDILLTSMAFYIFAIYSIV